MKQWIRYAAPLLLGGCAAFEDPEFWQAMADATNQAAATLQSGQGTYVAPQPAPVPYSSGSTAYTPYTSSPQPAQAPAPTPSSPAASGRSTQGPATRSSAPGSGPYGSKTADPAMLAGHCLRLTRDISSHYIENRCDRPVEYLTGCVGVGTITPGYPFAGVYSQNTGFTGIWSVGPGKRSMVVTSLCTNPGGRYVYAGCFKPATPYWTAPDLSRYVCLRD